MPSVGDGSSQVSSAAGSFNEGISVRPDCSHADTITPRQCSSFLSMRSASSLTSLRDDSSGSMRVTTSSTAFCKDRKSSVSGKCVTLRLDVGGRRTIYKQHTNHNVNIKRLT